MLDHKLFELVCPRRFVDTNYDREQGLKVIRYRGYGVGIVGGGSNLASYG